MKKSRDIPVSPNLIQLVLLTTAVIIFAVGYFMFYRFRGSETLTVYGSAVKNLNYPDTGLFWVPFWVEQAVRVKDRDFSPLGKINAEVIEKEAIADRIGGMQMNLTLKLNATRDRSGQLLYKNKPLTAGSIIELTLPKASLNLMITGFTDGKSRPEYKYIHVNAYAKGLEPWQSDNLNTGDSVRSSNGDEIIKLISKKEEYSRVSGQNEFGQKVEAINMLKKDITVTIRMKVTEKNGNYYFFGLTQIRPGLVLYVPWESGGMGMTVSGIDE